MLERAHLKKSHLIKLSMLLFLTIVKNNFFWLVPGARGPLELAASTTYMEAKNKIEVAWINANLLCSSSIWQNQLKIPAGEKFI